MQEETKEEYLLRLKKEKGAAESQEPLHEDAEPGKTSFRDKLQGYFFMLLFGLFLVAVLYIFGMMKGN